MLLERAVNGLSLLYEDIDRRLALNVEAVFMFVIPVNFFGSLLSRDFEEFILLNNVKFSFFCI